MEFTEETGRVVVVDEAYPRCGVAADVSSIIVEKAFSDLKAPIKKVTPPHSPVPYAPNLEQAFLPSSQNVIDKFAILQGQIPSLQADSIVLKKEIVTKESFESFEQGIFALEINKASADNPDSSTPDG